MVKEMHRLGHWPRSGRPYTSIRLRAVVADQSQATFYKEEAKNLIFICMYYN